MLARSELGVYSLLEAGLSGSEVGMTTSVQL